jgi:hypothetical protein
MTMVSKTMLPCRVPTGQVFAHKLVVFAYEDWGHFGLISSNFHWWWAFSRMNFGVQPNYSPTDFFETLPQPRALPGCECAGEDLNRLREGLMQARNEGLTKTYNRFHSRGDKSADIEALRESHISLDLACVRDYGWSDLDISHGFCETSQGIRFTIAPGPRREFLNRLLELNQQQYTVEEAHGLHKKRKSGPRRAMRHETPDGQLRLGDV